MVIVLAFLAYRAMNAFSQIKAESDRQDFLDPMVHDAGEYGREPLCMYVYSSKYQNLINKILSVVNFVVVGAPIIIIHF